MGNERPAGPVAESEVVDVLTSKRLNVHNCIGMHGVTELYTFIVGGYAWAIEKK